MNSNHNQKILAKLTKVVSNSQATLKFSSPNWRYTLTVKEIPLLEIGAPCETCAYYFKRLPGNEEVNLEVAQALSAALNAGITDLNDEIIDLTKKLIPDGEYEIILTRIKPLLCQSGDEDDFFSGNLAQVFQTDRHDPQTDYYLVRKRIHIRSDFPALQCEFIVPTQHISTLNPEVISQYRTLLAHESQPTAFAIGSIETKWPYRDDPYYGLNFLTHFVIDGHHKLYAAALENKEITLLSYIRKSKQPCKTETSSFFFNDNELSLVDRLHDACANNELEQVKKFVAQGAAITANSQQTPLHTACAHGRLEIANFLIEASAEIEAKNQDLETPLYVACKAGQFEIIKYLVVRGAHINIKNRFDRPLLHALCYGEHRLTYLIAKEIEPARVTLREHGLLEQLKFLVEHGANIRIKDTGGQTPLHISCYSFYEDYVEATKYLISQGADINAPDNNNITPWHIVNVNGEHELIAYFCEQGVNLNALLGNGLTPLQEACAYDRLPIVKYLIEHGADPEIKDDRGRTALDIARKNGQEEIVKYLLGQ